MPSQKLSWSHFVHQTPRGEHFSGEGQQGFILTAKNIHLSERSFDTPLSWTLYKYFGLVVFEWHGHWVSSFVSIVIASCLKLLFQTEIAGPLFFKDGISWDSLCCELIDGHYWSFIVNCLLGAQTYSLFFQVQDDSVYLYHWMQMNNEASPVPQGCEEECEEVMAYQPFCTPECPPHTYGTPLSRAATAQHSHAAPHGRSRTRRRRKTSRRRRSRDTCIPNILRWRSWANMQMSAHHILWRHDRVFTPVCPLLWRKRNSGGVSHRCSALLAAMQLFHIPATSHSLSVLYTSTFLGSYSPSLLATVRTWCADTEWSPPLGCSDHQLLVSSFLSSPVNSQISIAAAQIRNMGPNYHLRQPPTAFSANCHVLTYLKKKLTRSFALIHYKKVTLQHISETPLQKKIIKTPETTT